MMASLYHKGSLSSMASPSRPRQDRRVRLEGGKLTRRELYRPDGTSGEDELRGEKAEAGEGWNPSCPGSAWARIVRQALPGMSGQPKPSPGGRASKKAHCRAEPGNERSRRGGVNPSPASGLAVVSSTRWCSGWRWCDGG